MQMQAAAENVPRRKCNFLKHLNVFKEIFTGLFVTFV